MLAEFDSARGIDRRLGRHAIARPALEHDRFGGCGRCLLGDRRVPRVGRDRRLCKGGLRGRALRCGLGRRGGRWFRLGWLGRLQVRHVERRRLLGRGKIDGNLSRDLRCRLRRGCLGRRLRLGWLRRHFHGRGKRRLRRRRQVRNRTVRFSVGSHGRCGNGEFDDEGRLLGRRAAQGSGNQEKWKNGEPMQRQRQRHRHAGCACRWRRQSSGGEGCRDYHLAVRLAPK